MSSSCTCRQLSEKISKYHHNNAMTHDKRSDVLSDVPKTFRIFGVDIPLARFPEENICGAILPPPPPQCPVLPPPPLVRASDLFVQRFMAKDRHHDKRQLKVISNPPQRRKRTPNCRVVRGRRVYQTNKHGVLTMYSLDNYEPPLKADDTVILGALQDLDIPSRLTTTKMAKVREEVTIEQRGKRIRRDYRSKRVQEAREKLKTAKRLEETATSSRPHHGATERSQGKGCDCILHNEFSYCAYCPRTGCQDCTWYTYDAQPTHVKPTMDQWIVV